MSYNLLDRDEIIAIAEERRETIDELNETISAQEVTIMHLHNEVEQLRCYQHAINALMFLYRFCKEEADK